MKIPSLLTVCVAFFANTVVLASLAAATELGGAAAAAKASWKV